MHTASEAPLYLHLLAVEPEKIKYQLNYELKCVNLFHC